MRDGGGTGWEDATLSDIANKLLYGAQDLSNAASGSPPSPDAGTSSDVVGSALVAVVKAAATASALLEKTADKVNASLAAYEATETHNTDTMNNITSRLSPRLGPR